MLTDTKRGPHAIVVSVAGHEVEQRKEVRES